MNPRYYFLLLILSLLITACASNQWQPSNVKEVFVTDIKPSGLKIFNYSLINTKVQANGGARSGNGRGAGMGPGNGTGKHDGGKSGGQRHMGGGDSAKEPGLKPYYVGMLEAKLKNSGYCRQGYIELDSSFESGLLKMRGECVEGATEKDRIQFDNKESA